jgi:predicted Zn-dependent protease with MMP-like domain
MLVMAEYVENLQALLDTAYEMIAQDEIDQAWVLLSRLENDYPDSAEVVALMGDAAMRAGDVEFGLELYDRAVELDPEWSDAYSARGNCLIEVGQIEEAWADIERSLELDATNPEAHYIHAVLLEFDGRLKKADTEYRKANSLDPKGYPVPVRVSRKDFDQAVLKAIDLLPPRFKDLMPTVEIFVKDLPNPADTEAMQLSPLILGLFDGPSITEQNPSDPHPPMPPRIQLFQRNLERVSETREDLIREIEITLLHEVGHFFGLEEEDLDRVDLS